MSDCTVIGNIGGPRTEELSLHDFVDYHVESSVNLPFKMRILGNSWKDAQVTNPAHTYYLLNVTVIGNQENGGYAIGSGTLFSQFAHSLTSGGVLNIAVDNSGSATNEVWEYQQAFTPSWTSSPSNPSLGNGTLTSFYERSGRKITIKIDLIMGSTTTYGSGVWSFSLPVPNIATGDYVGTALLVCAGTTSIGVAFVSGSTVTIYTSAGSLVTPTTPGTWATGNRLLITVTYLL